MKKLYLNLRDGPPKRFLAYTVAPMLLMGSLSVNAENQRPYANFTVDPIYGSAPLTVNLDASSSYDTDGNITSYKWVFDTDKPEQQREPEQQGKQATVTFKTSGPHRITLYVYDDGTSNAFDKAHQSVIAIEAPPMNLKFTATPATSNPLSIDLDASNSSGNITDYEWSVSNEQSGVVQTANGETANLSLAKGTYSVALTVTTSTNQKITVESPKQVNLIAGLLSGGNNQGNNTSTGQPSNNPPVALFELGKPQGNGPFTVSVDANGSYDSDGTIEKYVWQYNGQTTEGKEVTLEFQNAGTYPITLTVTDDKGETGEKTQNIEIKAPEVGSPDPGTTTGTPDAGTTNPPVSSPNQPPTASFTYTVEPNQDGTFTVTLDGSDSDDPDPDGSIASYEWHSVTDGRKTSDNPTTFSFQNAGNYTVTLVVTDNEGAKRHPSIISEK